MTIVAIDPGLSAALFFLDPDGLKLEGMVFKPPRKKKRKGN